MRIVIVIVVLLLLLVGGAAAVYFLFPEVLPAGLSPIPTETPTPEGQDTPTPTEDPGVLIVTARVDIPENTIITDTTALLDFRRVSTDEYNARQELWYRDNQVSEVLGMVIDVPILAGEVIERSYVSKPGLSQQIPTAEPGSPRPKAYNLEVDTFSGVGDQVKSGDTVDVIATFIIRRRVYLEPIVGPALPSVTEDGQITFTQAPLEMGEMIEENFFSTKTIVQRAKVLDILRPPPPTPVPPQPSEDGEPPPPTPPPPPTRVPGSPGEPGRITEGTWQVIIAVNDQQAELIELAVLHDAQVTLVLRGVGDDTYEETMGSTLDLMLSEIGLPMPEPYNPFVFSSDVLTPQPTRTPVVTPFIP
jgi:pilus assembly protein CpaB